MSSPQKMPFQWVTKYHPINPNVPNGPINPGPTFHFWDILESVKIRQTWRPSSLSIQKFLCFEKLDVFQTKKWTCKITTSFFSSAWSLEINGNIRSVGYFFIPNEKQKLHLVFWELNFPSKNVPNHWSEVSGNLFFVVSCREERSTTWMIMPLLVHGIDTKRSPRNLWPCFQIQMAVPSQVRSLRISGVWPSKQDFWCNQ